MLAPEIVPANEATAAPKRGGDSVNHPSHYNLHPSGREAIEVVRFMGFDLGNATKYLWREAHKRSGVEDLRKAAWYIRDELASCRDVDAHEENLDDTVEASFMLTAGDVLRQERKIAAMNDWLSAEAESNIKSAMRILWQVDLGRRGPAALLDALSHVEAEIALRGTR